MKTRSVHWSSAGRAVTKLQLDKLAAAIKAGEAIAILTSVPISCMRGRSAARDQASSSSLVLKPGPQAWQVSVFLWLSPHCRRADPNDLADGSRSRSLSDWTRREALALSRQSYPRYGATIPEVPPIKRSSSAKAHFRRAAMIRRSARGSSV